MPVQPTNATDSQRAVPKRKSPLWRRLLVQLLAFYVAWCGTLFVLQEWLIFPADLSTQPPSEPSKPNVEQLWIDIGGGERVEAWFSGAPGFGPNRPAPVVIFFHGNAELIDDLDDVVGCYHRLGYSVLLPEYRGYGRSGGKPSQRGIRSDNVRFYDLIAERPDVDASRIIFHGRSLGGAVAADLTTERQPVALILQSTFTSMIAMAHRFWAPGFIVRHPFRTDDVLERFDGPLLIMHGTSDRVVPVSHGRRLAELNPNARYREFPAGHNDLITSDVESDYWKATSAFLTSARP